MDSKSQKYLWLSSRVSGSGVEDYRFESLLNPSSDIILFTVNLHDISVITGRTGTPHFRIMKWDNKS